ncbi:MAG: tRNA uridine-5-carboxymethylaminomethyl(34) synthesis GTPase MnmE [Lachnospiraceae bacterium]|nr:tRNA uridine-5-carboxymethylaminomethyl(34) synthesis GTPase MnmE [Lachnospiraceae bacterium]
MEYETIAAISTALSEGGIGIIRLSGEDSLKIVDRIYRSKNMESNLLSFKTHTIHYGFICDGEKILDEVMVSVMKAPNTFTRENVVEINCHGGVLVCRRILELCIKNGARLAEPGEFTKRAFLNGRIDLSKAEAVMDLISSKNNSALTNSVNQLKGRLYDKISDFRERILFETAFIESALDDPEHISLEGYPEKLSVTVDSLIHEIGSLYDTFKKGRFLKEGINTVIVGKPNVGKSSLLNVLTGYERAIVTDVAGTTRDTIEEQITINNISLNLFDTAGIRETGDKVENIGVERSKEYIKKADLVLFTIDTSSEITDEDREIASLIKGKKVLVILNKADKEPVLSDSDLSFLSDYPVVRISAKEGSGIEDLEAKIEEMFLMGEIVSDNEIFITNIRQAEELKKVLESLDLVKDSLSKGLPEDFYSIDLINAYSGLGRIIGENIDDDLANEIFSKFCMGK